MEDRVCQQHNGAAIKITPVPVGGTKRFHALIQSCDSPAGTRRKWMATKSIMHELRVKGDRGVMSHAFLMLISDSISTLGEENHSGSETVKSEKHVFSEDTELENLLCPEGKDSLLFG